ncbi:MAG: FKBP-type peptidyl-prolyl cis-trans isomerase [Verrucomicrobia bacterium]|nr:FKBP-type peptidyl-prolyl cis-trans isomerase [Verrucomicrobiota bacterium]
MNKMILSPLLITLGALCALHAEEAPKAQPADISRISEAFGHVIGKNLEGIGVKFDIAQVIKGLQDEAAGKNSPMTEMECVQAISAVQEKIFKEQCTENLHKAEVFLSEHAKAKGVVSLEEGKVQYEILSAGNGDVVESHFTPLIRYTGKHLDGTVFGASKEDEAIALDEVIPGLKAGLIGMKEGEKRTVYIHPDLAYGTNGYLPPNSLLTFEVEIVKANAPKEAAAETAAKGATHSHEIAEPETITR